MNISACISGALVQRSVDIETKKIDRHKRYYTWVAV